MAASPKPMPSSSRMRNTPSALSGVIFPDSNKRPPILKSPPRGIFCIGLAESVLSIIFSIVVLVDTQTARCDAVFNPKTLAFRWVPINHPQYRYLCQGREVTFRPNPAVQHLRQYSKTNSQQNAQEYRQGDIQSQLGAGRLGRRYGRV